MSHVTENVLSPFEKQLSTTTTTNIKSPSRYLKRTTYSPSRHRPVEHEFTPIDVPEINTTSTTTNRHISPPARHVTTTYHAAPLSPHRSTVVTHSPARQYTSTTQYSPVRNTVVTHSPARQYTTTTQYSPVRNTVVTHSPARQYTTTTHNVPASPARHTVVTQSPSRNFTSTTYNAPASPVRETIVSSNGFDHTSSTYSLGGRNITTTTVHNDIDVKSRVEHMLEHTRARLGTERVIPPVY